MDKNYGLFGLLERDPGLRFVGSNLSRGLNSTLSSKV